MWGPSPGPDREEEVVCPISIQAFTSLISHREHLCSIATRQCCLSWQPSHKCKTLNTDKPSGTADDSMQIQSAMSKKTKCHHH